VALKQLVMAVLFVELVCCFPSNPKHGLFVAEH